MGPELELEAQIHQCKGNKNNAALHTMGGGNGCALCLTAIYLNATQAPKTCPSGSVYCRHGELDRRRHSLSSNGCSEAREMSQTGRNWLHLLSSVPDLMVPDVFADQNISPDWMMYFSAMQFQCAEVEILCLKVHILWKSASKYFPQLCTGS